jgi:VIT1/CCC1 family predicted Fe2+/Mn2+ transporter
VSENGKSERSRILSPLERISEILFGLIMALTFTGALSAATAGHEEVRTMIFGAIGCNLAWGLVDGVMYLLNALTERGLAIRTFERVRRTQDPAAGHAIIADALPPVVASLLSQAELESIRQKIARMPAPPRPRLRLTDYVGALAVMLIVFLSTFPLVIPFLFVPETLRAMRLSNTVALIMLAILGYRLGRFGGYKPIVTALSMVGIGVSLVLITIALGG